MNIVIIEDEEVVADDLEQSILRLINEPVNIVKIHSVKEGIAYAGTSPHIDLIFSDIQLGDGLSFEIFIAAPMAAPVIFCTAYNEYALDAFKANGIDYILKPFSMQTLQTALDRFSQLKRMFTGQQPSHYEAIMQLLSAREPQRSSAVLVYHQDKIIPVPLTDIALFYLENEVTHLLTFAGKTYRPHKNLDELEKMGGPDFFRANRQYLVCRKVIVDVSNFFSRKLCVNLNIEFAEKIIVSKNKASQFLNWLTKAG